MNSLSEMLPWLVSMGVLIGLSAFFSASEAALFYLRPVDRRHLERGSLAEQMAARLLAEPERLLSAVLFWNLLVNVVYFALSSVVALQLQQSPQTSNVFALGFAFASLLTIIFFSEMLPKSLAVTHPRSLARFVSMPLSVAIRIVDPVLPVLRGATLLSRRLLWAGFHAEPDMELTDLERAIHLSGADEAIIHQEQTILGNIVHLSEIRVDEWMRPRTRFRVFRPPVTVEDLGNELPPSGYLLVSEPDSDEIDKALRLDRIADLLQPSIDANAKPVVYLPWKATVADALQAMADSGSDVTAVVNEFGDTIGIVTLHDVLETVFAYAPSRSKRILDLNPIHRISEDRWVVAGIMSLKRLARHFGVEVPASRNVTIAGVVQESVGRVVQPGDHCQWGPFGFRIVEAPQADNVLVELTCLRPSAGERP